MNRKLLLLTLALLLALTACTAPAQGELPSVSSSATPTAEPTQAPVETPTETPTEAPVPEEPEQQSEAYETLFALYRQVVEERWGGEELLASNMSLMLLDCYGASPEENIGYTYADLDGNGKEEFIVALTDAFTDEYYGKLVLAVYTLDEQLQPVQVLCSGDRFRYYYAGDNLFAFLGANSASDSVVTTLKLQDTELIDTTTTTDPADYRQLNLLLFW